MNPMVNHVKILGVLHIVFGSLSVVIGLALFAMFGGIAGIVGASAAPDEARVAIPVLGVIGSLLMLLMVALGLPGIIAGIGLMSFRPWARMLTIVISVLDLFQVPLGTLLGFYGLWVLFSRDGTALFEGRPPQFSSPQYGQPRQF